MTSVTELFGKYAAGSDKLDIEAICDLAEKELKLDVSEDITFYVLAWKLKAENPREISSKEWDVGMSAMGCKNLSDIQKRYESLRAEIANKSNFTSFNKWLFMWSKENRTARFIKKDTASANWSLILNYLPTGKWKYKDDWLEFIDSKFSSKTISEDLWTQLIVWIMTPKSDDLSTYDDTAAWPGAIDQFVEWVNGGKK